ncbi:MULTISPECIES: hypothetical protein [unclassified Pseudomonas]|uniref:hypothetical protein n=1 Tax=unclassified Pseudomonas TaxID=196821 RepID=UPI001F57F7C1|nr:MULTISPECIES: hypothetical protein [unclassified Pseudomonas]
MSEPYDEAPIAVRGPINVVLDDWRSRWVMMGQSLYCVDCHAGQDALYAAQAFVHKQSCTLIVPTFQYPWYELRGALGHLPKVKL